MNDKKLIKIMSKLKELFKCHTIILYGSRARGDGTSASDYDLIAIRKSGSTERYAKKAYGTFLDVFIYSEKNVINPDSSFIRMKDGIVLCQKNQYGDELIKKVKSIYKKGPKKIPKWEKQMISTWSEKMLSRAKIEDVEGNFRRHWLLFDLLEAYFQLRDRWYLGPKESFQWLMKNDIASYRLFSKALKPDADLKCLHKLVKRVNKYS